MTTRFWWIFMAVVIGALVAVGLPSRLYVGQHFAPQLEINGLLPQEREMTTLMRLMGKSLSVGLM